MAADTFQLLNIVQKLRHMNVNFQIRARYDRCLSLLPQFVDICDICSIYDNSLETPFRIYKKYHGAIIQSNAVWSKQDILKLVHGD